jgi:large subunit ribosomal protein L5
VKTLSIKEFGYAEPDAGAAPREDRVNMGVGEAVPDPRRSMPRSAILTADRRAAAGRDPSAKRSIATFKLREGMPIGAKVTLAQATGCTNSSTG